MLERMSSHIPGCPTISYWEASPHFRELCMRKLGSGYIQGEPLLAEMGRRAAFELMRGVSRAVGLSGRDVRSPR